ncbi:MAG: universal stress protein [Burkholderiales bacterium]
MYKRILVPIDGSPASQRGLSEALSLAKQNKAQLRLLHVVGLFIPTPTLAVSRDLDDIPKALHETGQALLKKSEALVRRHHIAVDTAMVDIVAGRAADAIVKHAEKWRADLIVIGTHGRRGLNRIALGSDAEKVVRNSPVPVLVVRPSKTARR